jgi:hypothetical protein
VQGGNGSAVGNVGARHAVVAVVTVYVKECVYAVKPGPFASGAACAVLAQVTVLGISAAFTHQFRGLPMHTAHSDLLIAAAVFTRSAIKAAEASRNIFDLVEISITTTTNEVDWT